MSLEWVHFDLPATTGSAATISKSINGVLKKLVINRDTSNFTLDVDLTNQNGTKEPIIDGLVISADTVKYPMATAHNVSGGNISGLYNEIVCNGKITVDASVSNDGLNHDVWVLVDKFRD
jgi:hypothetical protein